MTPTHLPKIYTENQALLKTTCSPVSLGAWATGAAGVVSFLFAVRSENKYRELTRTIWKECPWRLSHTVHCISLKNQQDDERMNLLIIYTVAGICLLTSVYLFSRLCLHPMKYEKVRFPNGAQVFVNHRKVDQFKRYNHPELPSKKEKLL